MLVSVALPTSSISYKLSSSGKSVNMDSNKNVNFTSSSERVKKIKRKASETLEFESDTGFFKFNKKNDYDTVARNVDPIIQGDQFSQEKLNNFCNNIKSGTNQNNNVEDDDYDGKTSVIPVITKKPKFLINDLLSAPKTAAGLLTSVLIPKSPKSYSNNFNLPIANNTCSSSNLAAKKQANCLENETTPTRPKQLETVKELIIPPNFIPNGKSSKMLNLRCRLEPGNQMLWTKFSKIGTEMIITKPGRRMFPTIKIRLENCDVNSNYYVYLDAVPVDAKRYRYVYSKSAWCCSGKADRTPPNRLYMHPDSPFSGAQLSSHIISFEKAKLTNNESDSHGHLVLNSMHKYQSRLHILRRDRSLPALDHGGQNVNLCAFNYCDDYKTYIFSETQFMAVTAYQNQLVTEMKIAMNPFAKGFRDHGNRSETSSDFLETSTSPMFTSIDAYGMSPHSSNLLNSHCSQNNVILSPASIIQQQQQKKQQFQQQLIFNENKNNFKKNMSLTYAQALSTFFASKTLPISTLQPVSRQPPPPITTFANSWTQLAFQQQQQQQQQQRNLLQHQKQQEMFMQQYLQMCSQKQTNLQCLPTANLFLKNLVTKMPCMTDSVDLLAKPINFSLLNESNQTAEVIDKFDLTKSQNNNNKSNYELKCQTKSEREQIPSTSQDSIMKYNECLGDQNTNLLNEDSAFVENVEREKTNILPSNGTLAFLQKNSKLGNSKRVKKRLKLKTKKLLLKSKKKV